MIRGLLAFCEDHKRPLRACLAEQGTLVLGRGMVLLRRALNDEEGCSYVIPLEVRFRRCQLVPAVYWIECACGCGFAQRVCKLHRGLELACSQVAPPAGTGMVPRQNIGRSKTDS